MKQGQYLIVMILGSACLLCAIIHQVIGALNRDLQRELAAQQQILARSNLAPQYMAPILQDMNAAASTNAKI